MGKSSSKERIAKLEEQMKFADKERSELEREYKQRVTNINEKLNMINSEQGETRDAVNRLNHELSAIRDDLKNTIKKQVSAPISGRDRAVLYGTAITAIFTFLSVTIPAILDAFF